MDKPDDTDKEKDAAVPAPMPGLATQVALQAKIDAFLKLLEDKRSLAWTQFATD